MDFGFPLDSDESIQRVIHRHWASLVPSLGIATLATVAAASIGYMLARYPTTMPSSRTLGLLLVIIMALIAGGIVTSSFFLYDHNLLVFTTRRLIAIKQRSLISRHVAQLNLLHIEDATGHCTGLLNTLLNFGVLEIETGSNEPFVFRSVPNPITLADETIQAHNERKHEKESDTPAADKVS